MNKYFTPVRTITTADGSSVDAIYDAIVANVTSTKLFRPFRDNPKFPNAKIFSKGHAIMSFIDDSLPVFRYEGYYFCVVEKDVEENKVYVSLHNFSFLKTEEFLEKFDFLFEPTVGQQVRVSPWSEARDLPKRLLSNGFTFIKARGLKYFLF